MPPLSTILGAIDTYWYVIAAIATFLVAVWKMIPVETRDAIERRVPRLVGAVRLLIAILPDLVTAGRALRIQIVGGQPKRASLSQPPPPPPRRQGYFRFPLLLLALGLSACPLPPPDGCTPLATRCSPAGVPQRCSQTQRWSSGSLATCGGSATCCLARSPYGGRLVHACVPRAQCLPEPTLADVIGAVDAAEGGAQ